MHHTPESATLILRSCQVKKDRRTKQWPDFHVLRGQVVLDLKENADRDGYREPKNANGSRTRYYYSMLVRIANRGD